MSTEFESRAADTDGSRVHRSSRIAAVHRNFGSVGALAIAALLCAGCDTSPYRGDYPPERPGERRVQYNCRDGQPAELHILEAQGIALLNRGGRTLRLKLQSSDSGFIYSDGANTVRSKGRDLRLDIAGSEPVECRSQSE